MNVRSLLVTLGFEVKDRPLERVQQLLQGVQSRLSLLAGAQVIRGLVSMGERFSSIGVELEAAAASAGVTTEAFQRMAYAAAQNNVSSEELSKSLAALNRKMFEARKGGEGAIEAFAYLGISPEQIAGFKSSEEALGAVSDAVSRIGDTSKRTALTMQLLGDGSSKMVMMMAKGSKQLRAQGMRGSAMGAIVSTKDVATLADLSRKLGAFWASIRGIASTIAAHFAPALTAAIDGVMRFYAAHRELIMTTADAWVNNFAFALGFVYEALKVGSGALVNFIGHHKKLIDYIEKYGPALAALVVGASYVAPAFRTVVSVVRSATAAFALLTGTTSVWLGIIALGVLTIWAFVSGLKAVWDHAHGKPWETTAFAKSFGMIARGAKFAGGAIADMFSAFDENATPEELAVSQRGGGKFAGLNSITRGISSAMDLKSMSGPGMMGIPAGPVAGGAGTVNQAVTNNFTVNVGDKLTQDQASKAVKDGVQDHLDQQVRDSMLAIKRAAIY